MRLAYVGRGRLPITVICGLPSAGKTTLAEYLREECASSYRARCVMLRHEHSLDAVRYLAEYGATDYVLLELSGTSDPESVAAQLSPGSGAEAGLAQLVRLDAVVTVVDTVSLLSDFSSWHTLADRGFALGPQDHRPLAEVLAAQVEFADVVVLNRSELASAGTRHAAGVLVRALNPDATIIETASGRVPERKVLFTYAFEFAQAQGHARWIRALSSAAGCEADAHGISSFVYGARRPFHPQRLMEFVRSPWPGVVRCRGCFWLATRMDVMGELSQAGAARRFRAAGGWWASVSEERPVDSKIMEDLAGVPWDPGFGDRRQELAFVGIDMDQAHLRQRLDECLLDDREFTRGPESWQGYEDPFPALLIATHAYRPAGLH